MANTEPTVSLQKLKAANDKLRALLKPVEAAQKPVIPAIPLGVSGTQAKPQKP
jgi:hypothetical protein